MTRRLGFASVVWLAFATAGLSGCHATGPSSIRVGRGNYNIALQQTNNQQLLLNLVRLRYRDTPVFLAVSSISTSFTFEVGGGATVGDVAELGVVGVAGSLAYAEKPTITYAPLQGQQFVNQLMSPMSLRVILLLYHSGWRIDRVLKTCLQSFGNLPNAPGAASPTPVVAPEYEEFAKLARNLRTLQSKGLIDVGQTGEDEEDLVVQIHPGAVDLPAVQDIARALRLPSTSTRFTLTTRGSDERPAVIPVVTRSVVGSMFFLSQGVDAPMDDERAGRVTVTLDADGGRFDWSTVTGELLRIRSSDDPPDNAYTGVAYRGSWFYIDDSDLESKSTFSLLTQILALQAGSEELRGPVLTLPVR